MLYSIYLEKFHNYIHSEASGSHPNPRLLPAYLKILLKRIYLIINEKIQVHNTQFGFRNKHLELHQVHKITDIYHHPYIINIIVKRRIP